jgi:hypothetical protein
VTTYEKLVDGVVVERVIPIDGDYTDTLLGCLALDYTGGDGWRREGQVVEQPAEVEQQEPPAAPQAKQDTPPAKPGKPGKEKTDGS